MACTILESCSRIALAVDVTAQLANLKAVQTQNQQLRDIAWMQSHTIRAPLSRIMGLIELLKDTGAGDEELDTVIHSISANAREK